MAIDDPRLVRRRLAALAFVAGMVGLSIAIPPRPLLVWNVSASAPVGIYAVGGRDRLARGDMVIASVPAPWRAFAASRHYLPANVPLVKRIAAVPGDRVCAAGESLFVNGARVAQRLAVDGRGRQMPRWSGCATLAPDAVLLLMDAPDSFDGRYFGPTRRDGVIGKARLIWSA